jgi:hypothetical protein
MYEILKVVRLASISVLRVWTAPIMVMTAELSRPTTVLTSLITGLSVAPLKAASRLLTALLAASTAAAFLTKRVGAAKT